LPYQFRERGDFVEVELEGFLDSIGNCMRDLAAGSGCRNVLLNLTGVTSVVSDTYALADQVQSAVLQGFRLAFFAPRPALFGISRQTLQLGNVEEGTSAAVFSDVDAAREWLLSA
jgi:hypothetical protein